MTFAPVKPLDSVCQLVSGQHIDAKDYNLHGRGIGYLTGPSDFGMKNPVVSKWTEFPKVTAKTGDILITVKGSGVGKINVLAADSVAISRQLMAIRVTAAHPEYVYAFLDSQSERLHRMATGAAIPGLSREQILGLQIPLPPLAEQRRIMAILDKAFAGLEVMRANAEKNLKNAREILDAHLLEVFTREWPQKPVASVAEHCLGKMLDKRKNKGELKPYLRNLNVRWFAFNLNDVLEMRFEKDELERYSARFGDVIVCEGGYPGRAAIWESEEPIYLQKALHRVRFRETVMNKWFCYYLYASDKSGQLRSHFTGAGIQHFTGQALARFQLPVPSADEVARHNRVFDDLRTEVEKLEDIIKRKVDLIDDLKASILNRAFSGELTSAESIAA